MSAASATTVQARCGCGYLHPVQVGRLVGDAGSQSIESRSVSPNAGALRERTASSARASPTPSPLAAIPPGLRHSTAIVTQGTPVDAIAFSSEHKLSLVAVADISEKLDHREKELIQTYAILSQYQKVMEEQKAHIESDATRHQQQLASMRERLVEKEQLSGDRLSEIHLLREESDRLRSELRGSDEAEEANRYLTDCAEAGARQMAELTRKHAALSEAHSALLRSSKEADEKLAVTSRQLHEAHLQLQLSNTEAGRENRQLRKEMSVLAEQFQSAEQAVLQRTRDNTELLEECQAHRSGLGGRNLTEVQADVARLVQENTQLKQAALHDASRLRELSDAFDLIEPVQEEFRSRLREYSEATEEVRGTLAERDAEIHALRSQAVAAAAATPAVQQAQAQAQAHAEALEEAHHAMRTLKRRLADELAEFLPDTMGDGGAQNAASTAGSGSPRSPYSRLSGDATAGGSPLRSSGGGGRTPPSDQLVQAASDCKTQCDRACVQSRQQAQDAQQLRNTLQTLLVDATGDAGVDDPNCRLPPPPPPANPAALPALCAEAVRKLRRQADKMRGELEDLTLDYNDISAELSEAQRQARQAETQRDDAVQRAARPASPDPEIPRLERANTSLADQVDSLRTALAESEEDRARLSSETQALASRGGESEARLAAENGNLAAQLEALRAEHEEVCRQAHEAHRAVQGIGEMEEELRSSRAEVQRLQKGQASMERMLEMLQQEGSQGSDAEDVLASVLSRFEQAERALDILQQQRASGEARLHDALGEVDELHSQLEQLRKRSPPGSPDGGAGSALRQEVASLRELVDQKDAEIALMRNSSMQSTAAGGGVPLDMTFQQTPVLLDKIQHEAGVQSPEMHRLRERLAAAEQEYVEARRAQDVLQLHPSKLPGDHPAVVALRRAEEKLDDITSVIRMKAELEEARRLPPLNLEGSAQLQDARQEVGALRAANKELVQENELLHEQLAEERTAARRGSSPKAHTPPRHEEVRELQQRNKELQGENGSLMRDVAELQHAVSEMEDVLAQDEREMPSPDALRHTLADEQSKRKQLAAKNRRLEAELEKLTSRPHREGNVRKELKDVKSVVEELRKENWRLRKALTEIEQEKDLKFMKHLNKLQRMGSRASSVSRQHPHGAMSTTSSVTSRSPRATPRASPLLPPRGTSDSWYN